MTARKLSRRDFLLLSGGTAGGALLAACGPAPTPEVITELVEVTRVVEVEGETIIETVIEEVEVEVEKEVIVTAVPVPARIAEIRLAEGSWVGPEGITFWSDEIIGRFELENPDIKVTFENAESPDYSDKLFTQSVAGDAPDVMFIWGSFGYELMQKGQFLELDPYFDATYMEGFYPAKLPAHEWEGHRYGLPKYEAAVCLAYNKDILDEAGVDYPDDTWTWDDYLLACQATAKRDASGELVQWGTYVLHLYLMSWVWGNGAEWMDAPAFGTKSLLNEPKAFEALQFQHELIWGAEPVSPRPGQIPEYNWPNIFSTGKIAFMDSMSWTVTNYVLQWTG